MNIFILDKNPIKSGQILLKADKRRALKMCVEFLQASAVLAEDFGLNPIRKKDGTPYKTTLARSFPKPIMKWLREDRHYFKWVWIMCYEINKEFANNKNSLILSSIFSNLPEKYINEFFDDHRIPNSLFVNYAKSNDKGLDFTSEKDVVKAYHLYLEAQGVKF